MAPCLCPFPDRIGRRHIVGRGEQQQQLRIANPILFLSHLFVISLLLLPFAGTAGIIMAAPSHYDISKPIDIQYSRIEMKNMMKMEEL